MHVLLSPPLAFLIYIPLVVLILLLGRSLAGPSQATPAKTSLYGSGESAPSGTAAPGYRPFFMVAFFFAILHLGVLVLASAGLTLTAGVYLLGLMLALVALILG
jgi:NADH:ubiquinone oxidoreductase subunit 3 (subunit A)